MVPSNEDTATSSNDVASPNDGISGNMAMAMAMAASTNMPTISPTADDSTSPSNGNSKMQASSNTDADTLVDVKPPSSPMKTPPDDADVIVTDDDISLSNEDAASTQGQGAPEPEPNGETHPMRKYQYQVAPHIAPPLPARQMVTEAISEESEEEPERRAAKVNQYPVKSYHVAPGIAPPLPDRLMAIRAISEESEEESEKRAAKINQYPIRRYQVAPGIAPPLPARLNVIGAISEGSEEESERRAATIKQAMEVEESFNDKIPSGSGLAMDHREDFGSESQDNGTGESGGDARNSNESPMIGEDNRFFEDNETTTRNDTQLTHTTSTAVYDGSVARCSLVSPPRSQSEVSEDPPSIFYDSSRPVEIPEAYLVEPGSSIFGRRSSLVHAEPMAPWYKRRWGKIMISIVLLLVGALVLALNYKEKPVGPSMSPTPSPTTTPPPTLTIVKERDELKCGLKLDEPAILYSNDSLTFRNITWDLCRAIASAVLGDPEKIVPIHVTAENRFEELDGRNIDVLIWGDSDTLEREISERTTGTGFSFSRPYFHAGMVFVGMKPYVECAESGHRYGNCSDTKICVHGKTSVHSRMESIFPTSFLVKSSTIDDMVHKFDGGECNAVVSDLFQFLTSRFYLDVKLGTLDFIEPTTRHGVSPHAMVTKKDDHQWSDIVEGVLFMLFQGWTDGVGKDASLCPDSLQNENVLGISFWNAPRCMGNFGDIFRRNFPVSFMQNVTGETTNQDTGMIIAPGLGSLVRPAIPDAAKKGTLREILEREKLNCGVVKHAGNKNLTSMSAIYCNAVAAAIFQGDWNAVNITYLDSFSESSDDLRDKYGAFDIIAGYHWWDLQGWGSPYISWRPTIPYYFLADENGQVGRAISLITRHEEDDEDDVFSSFANAVVTATVYAVRNDITKAESVHMPFNEMFGNELRFMLKDVILSVGNHHEIYDESHGTKDMEGNKHRGVNYVNTDYMMTRSYNMLCTMGTCDE